MGKRLPPAEANSFTETSTSSGRTEQLFVRMENGTSFSILPATVVRAVKMCFSSADRILEVYRRSFITKSYQRERFRFVILGILCSLRARHRTLLKHMMSQLWSCRPGFAEVPLLSTRPSCCSFQATGRRVQRMEVLQVRTCQGPPPGAQTEGKRWHRRRRHGELLRGPDKGTPQAQSKDRRGGRRGFPGRPGR